MATPTRRFAPPSPQGRAQFAGPSVDGAQDEGESRGPSTPVSRLGPEPGRQVRARQGVGDVGHQETDLRAAVVDRAVEADGIRTAGLRASSIIASVTWISPPAPRSPRSRMAKISGCRM